MRANTGRRTKKSSEFIYRAPVVILQMQYYSIFWELVATLFILCGPVTRENYDSGNQTESVKSLRTYAALCCENI